MTNPPYTYTDGQSHRLTLDPVAGAAGTPFVRVTAEDTAIGGDITSVWLTLDQAAALDRHLSAGIACELTDHTGDTLTVTGSDDFTTFTVTRVDCEDDDRASVPVVALTGRLPEIRRALTATAEEAQQPATADVQAVRRAMLDQLGTLAHVAIWAHPAKDMPENTDATAIEVAWGGLGRYATAYALRQVADRLTAAADAAGETPLDTDAVAVADERNKGLDAGVPATGDVFTEAAIARSALLAGITAVEALPQDYECDPGRGDAVKVLRRLADHYTTNEQPAGLTWEARTEHAVRLYATTAIERDDARAEAARLREQLHGGAELDQSADVEERSDTIESLLAEIADDIPNRRADAIAADYLARHTRLLAAEAHAHTSQRGKEMHAEGYRGRVAWTSGMREVARLLDARAVVTAEAGR